jgi:flagellar hook-associated protein 1 FlgK
MASTFLGLNTAYTSLVAQRQALEVAGQNVANANTVGYTRQRADLAAIPGGIRPAMFSTWNGVGQGVQVTNFARLNDVFVDARVRTHTSNAAYLGELAAGAAKLEGALGEPSDNALSKQLDALWSSFNDVANTPDKQAAIAVVLQKATDVATKLSSLRGEVATQWQQARTTAVALVDEANARADNIADLNTRIRDIVAAGGSANELMDARDQQITALSALVGATSTTLDDGTVEVLVGGSSMVTGPIVRHLAVTGADFLDQSAGQAGPAPAPIQLEWASRPGSTVGLDGGRIAGIVSNMAATYDANNVVNGGGLLAETAAKLDAFTVDLANQINNILAGADTSDPLKPALPLYSFGNPPKSPPARHLTVDITDPADLNVRGAGAGPLDGSIAAQIAGLGTKDGGPTKSWSTIVVDLGVKTASANSRATVAEVARASAESDQLSIASVDVDQETVDMLAFQRAYEGAARVLTAIDEMLDVLINRTGRVGL